MGDLNCEFLFDFLTPEKKAFLNEKFRVGNIRVMPHELSGPLNISYSDAIAILTFLQAAKLSRSYIIVYHKCEPDLAIETIPFEEGFPSVPWFCSNCQETVEDLDELSFNIMAVSKEPIRFI